MDHKYIDKFDLVDRYLMGRLAVEETSQFEEHFVDCVECVDRLNSTKAFIEELRRVGFEHSLEAAAAPTGRFRHVPRKVITLAAGLILLIALAGVAPVFNQARRAQSDAAQAKSASAEWERRYDLERQSSAIAENGHQETKRELSEKVDQLKTQLDDARKQAASEINVPLLALSSTRRSKETSGSTDVINIPSSAVSFVLSLALEGETDYRNYRMTIRDSRRRLVLKARGVKPASYNSVTVRLNSSLFRPGDYLATLHTGAAHQGAGVVGEYSFRVHKSR